jgi:mono/diheme cytochrome c family protein
MKTKLIAGLILLTFILAACGGSPTQTAPEPAASPQAESQPTVVPTLTTAPPTETEAVAPTMEATEPATEVPVTGGVSFANDVMPILAGSCRDCHGGNQTRAGLNLTTYESLMSGSINGAVVVAGNSADSVLVQLVTEGKMPKRGPKLSPEQVQTISDWIAAGAPNN